MQPDVENRIGAVIARVAAENPKWAVSKKCFDQARKACQILSAQLAEAGIASRIVRLKNFQDDVSKAHQQWRWLGGGEYFSHCVLLVDDIAIDMTARQFDPDDDFPRISSAGDLYSRWVDATVLAGADSTDTEMPLRRHIELRSGTRPFAPRIERHASGQLFYRDDHVIGAVDIAADGSLIIIRKWGSFHHGQGNTARALEWLRSHHGRILVAASEHGRNDERARFWKHMEAKGSIDALVDRHGLETGMTANDPEPEAGPSL